jgi:DNA-binding NarL/FixJ family response regulator
MEQLRVVVADDHPVFRDGLRMLLTSIPEFDVVGEAASGAEVVELAASLQPDVIVMDLHMPEMNGIEATRRAVSASPHVGVLVLTMYEDNDSVFAAMRAGAKGYLLKGADQAEIVRATQAVASGEAIFGPAIAERVIRYFSASRVADPALPFLELTDREREVLGLIAKGQSNQAIAQGLVLSPKTVRNHVSNIFAKLQVADRSEAIVRAREAGLGRPYEGPE